MGTSKSSTRHTLADACFAPQVGRHEPPSVAAAVAAELAQAALPKEVDGVSNEEAIRRLRLLGHPATLFGETERDRLLRLHVVQRNISLQAQARVLRVHCLASHKLRLS